MSSWSEIKNAFFNWMEINNKNLDEDVNQNSRYDIMRSDEFRAFIVEYDEEDNTDTFKFSTKTNDLDETRKKEEEERQRLIEENDGKALEPGENRAFVNVEVEDSDDLAHDMVNSFLAGLDKTNEKDMAIIKAIGGDDGIISTEERDNFENKIIQHGFDGDKTDLSYTDVKSAIKTMMEDEDNSFEFLQETPGVDQTGGSDQVGGGDPPAGDPTEAFKGDGTEHNPVDPEQVTGKAPEPTPTVNPKAPEVVQAVQSFESIVGDYTPKIINVTPTKLANVTQNDGLLNTNFSSLGTVDACDKYQTDLLGEINTAKSNYNEYKTAFTSSSSTYNKAAQYVESNNAAYNAIIQELTANDENVKMYNDNITNLTSQQEATQSALNVQYELKDTLTLAIGGIDGQISSLQGNLWKNEEYTDTDGTVKTRQVKNTAVEAQIAELKAEKARLETELAEIAQSILETQKTLDEICTNLDKALECLNCAIQDSNHASAEQREMMNGIIQNKRNMNEAYQDMQEAKSGMVAMDAYALSLQNKYNDVCEVRAELEEKAKEEATEGEDVENDENNYTNDSNKIKTGMDSYPEDIPGLIHRTLDEIGKNDSGNYTFNYTNNEGEELNIEITKDKDGNFIYNIVNQKTGASNALQIAGDNVVLEVYKNGGTQSLYQETNNPDGTTTRTIVTDPNEDGAENRSLTTTTDENGNTISNQYTISKFNGSNEPYEVVTITENYTYDNEGNITGINTQSSVTTPGGISTQTSEVIKEGNKTTTTITDSSGQVLKTEEIKETKEDGTTITDIKTERTVNGEPQYSNHFTIEETQPKIIRGGSQYATTRQTTTITNVETGEKTVTTVDITTSANGKKTETTTTVRDANGGGISSTTRTVSRDTTGKETENRTTETKTEYSDNYNTKIETTTTINNITQEKTIREKVTEYTNDTKTVTEYLNGVAIKHTTTQDIKVYDSTGHYPEITTVNANGNTTRTIQMVHVSGNPNENSDVCKLELANISSMPDERFYTEVFQKLQSSGHDNKTLINNSWYMELSDGTTLTVSFDYEPETNILRIR